MEALVEGAQRAPQHRGGRGVKGKIKLKRNQMVGVQAALACSLFLFLFIFLSVAETY